MTPTDPELARKLARSQRRWVVSLAVTALLMLAAAAWGYYRYYPDQVGPAQPISFSHHVHATNKQLSCVMCHTGVADTPRAGIPPVETCMLCHTQVIITHPEIRKLRDHFEHGQPVQWVRVNDLPEICFFNHQVHVNRGIDCSRCHGDVKTMDRVTLAHKFQMGFCIQCHRDYNVSHDCLTCHR